MGISASGERGLSVSGVRSLIIVFTVFLGAAIYFYGPPVTPALRAAATAECNDYAGGNFRSYQLHWVTGPGSTPHWQCWDASRPTEKAISLGWWVDPFS
jgi:hypothetical protein